MRFVSPVRAAILMETRRGDRAEAFDGKKNRNKNRKSPVCGGLIKEDPHSSLLEYVMSRIVVEREALCVSREALSSAHVLPLCPL